jgi:hypothetical protein
VELSKRELHVLVGVLEAEVKDMEADADPYGMGVPDPDRESDLQELRDLHGRLYEALVELGRRVPPE